MLEMIKKDFMDFVALLLCMVVCYFALFLGDYVEDEIRCRNGAKQYCVAVEATNNK